MHMNAYQAPQAPNNSYGHGHGHGYDAGGVNHSDLTAVVPSTLNASDQAANSGWNSNQLAGNVNAFGGGGMFGQSQDTYKPSSSVPNVETMEDLKAEIEYLKAKLSFFQNRCQALLMARNMAMANVDLTR